MSNSQDFFEKQFSVNSLIGHFIIFSSGTCTFSVILHLLRYNIYSRLSLHQKIFPKAGIQSWKSEHAIPLSFPDLINLDIRNARNFPAKCEVLEQCLCLEIKVSRRFNFAAHQTSLGSNGARLDASISEVKRPFYELLVKHRDEFSDPQAIFYWEWVDRVNVYYQLQFHHVVLMYL